MRHTKRLTTLIATAALSVGVAAPASAQTTQDGLVNVALTDNTIQVPVSVAANVCDVAVNVLARSLKSGDTDCMAGAESVAVDRDTGNGGPTTQNGLVNLSVTDNTIQVPVSVAANVCDVSVAALAEFIDVADTACTADASSSGNDAR